MIMASPHLFSMHALQGRMLDELDEDVDTTHSRLRATQKKVGLLLLPGSDIYLLLFLHVKS